MKFLLILIKLVQLNLEKISGDLKKFLRSGNQPAKQTKIIEWLSLDLTRKKEFHKQRLSCRLVSSTQEFFSAQH